MGVSVYVSVCEREGQCEHVSVSVSVSVSANTHTHTHTHIQTNSPTFHASYQVRNENMFLRNCPHCNEDIEMPADMPSLILGNSDRASIVPSSQCRCNNCRLGFCPHCWQRFHYSTTCSEAAKAVVRWQSFMEVHKDICGSLAQHARSHFERRREENQATARMCRRCPHCNSGPVYRIDGV